MSLFLALALRAVGWLPNAKALERLAVALCHDLIVAWQGFEMGDYFVTYGALLGVHKQCGADAGAEWVND
jgi:hypothetical protein